MDVQERKTFYEGMVEGFDAIRTCKPTREELEEILEALEDGINTFNRGRCAAYREYLDSL